MKTKHEIMTEMIVKADWLIEHVLDRLKPGPSMKWFSVRDEYTRLRAELAEVKERSAEEILDTFPPVEYLHAYILDEFHKYTKNEHPEYTVNIDGSELSKIIAIAKTRVYSVGFSSQSAPMMPMFEDDSNMGNEKRDELMAKRHLSNANGEYSQGFADCFNWVSDVYKSKMK